MNHLDNMTDEQIITGLMRGEKRSFKVGYDPAAAVYALENLRYADNPLHDEDRHALMQFARGFALGMREDSSEVNPARLARV